MKFKQITTGPYTYKKEGHIEESHVIYGLDEEGQIWKYVASQNKWLLLVEANFFRKNND